MSGNELELKAVVPDVAAVRRAILAAGAVLRWSGLMVDRRFDRRGELTARDEVLRTREYRATGGAPERAQLAWKGATGRSAEGYKSRRELELSVTEGAPAELLHALGYGEVHAIDRWIEEYDLAGAMIRIEWYPRMDVLLEVEGDPAMIERAIAATGLPRSSFLPDALADFVSRYDARGRRAAVSLAELGEGRPSWEDR